MTLTIVHLSQVSRETEFSPQTDKPNKKSSKTAPDTRHSFINKDVLSMKIITAAKQNIVQDPELLSKVCQQTLIGGRDDATGSVSPKSPTLHLFQSTFQQYHLLIHVLYTDSVKALGVLGFPMSSYESSVWSFSLAEKGLKEQQ